MAVRRGEAGARRIEPGQDTGSGRRAQRAGRVGAAKRHAALGQLLDIGCLVELGVTVEGRVRPAEIVGEDEDDVRLPPLIRGGIGCAEQGEEGDQDCERLFHGVVSFARSPLYFSQRDSSRLAISFSVPTTSQ